MRRGARLLAAFLLATLGAHAGAEDRTVQIESARSTEYSGATGENGDETVRFTGDVSILVTEGSSESRISADEIVYDKTKETLYARGNVRFERKTGEKGGQTFTGEALLFNIRDQEGEFLEGSMTQDSGKTNGDPYIVNAEISGRDSGATMAFKNATITTCDDPDPHWYIKATRIWLLPGNEMALLNGIFFIGPMPVLYIPAFYYPSDEMIVNPVFGVRNREGAFVQTTTYLFGRKPLAKDATGATSFTNFMQSDTLKEQERNGLFLKNLETDAKGGTSDYLKLMLDAYSSLGAMGGLEGSFAPKDSYLKSVSFSSLFGVSRTLYPPLDGINYTAWEPGGTQHWDSGWAFGYEIPFRYRFDFSASMDKSPFKLSVKLPLISDPYFKKDFMDRSEDLNWFKYLLNQEELAQGSGLSAETSYAWTLNGSVTPTFSVLKPWVNTASVSSLTGTVTFNSKTNTGLSGIEASYTSERTFFYPEVIKPTVSLAFGGTLLSGGKSVATTAKPTSAPAAAKSGDIEKADTGTLPNPFDAAPETPAPSVDGTGQADKSPPGDGANEAKAIDRAFPKLELKNGVAAYAGERSWSIDWSFKPSWLEEIRYDTTDWTEPSDVDWNEFSSVYNQAKTAAKLNGAFAAGSLFKASSSLDFSSTYQNRPYVSDSVAETTQTANRLADYKASVWLLSSTDAVTLSPFPKPSAFYPTSLAWNFTGDLSKSVFTGTVDDPEWETKQFQWDRDYVRTHNTSLTAGVSLAENVQTLKLVSSLDPLLQSYEGDLSLAWAPLSATGGTKLYEKENESKRWFWDPLDTAVSLALPLSSSFKQAYTYNIEDGHPESLVYTLAVPYAAASYALNYALPYRLEPGTGWVVDGTEKKFLPTSASLTLSNTAKPYKGVSWKKRIAVQFSLASNLKFDLLRATDSSLDFAPNLTFKIYDFLDLSFSTVSRNDVIARYYQEYLDLPITLPGETNPFADLADSFAFWDTATRTESGFKLKSLSLKATHYLHDWTASLDTTVQPELIDTGSRYYYDFKPIITFMVQWKPISDIKTTVKSEKGTFTLNTSSSDSD